MQHVMLKLLLRAIHIFHNELWSREFYFNVINSKDSDKWSQFIFCGPAAQVYFNTNASSFELRCVIFHEI